MWESSAYLDDDVSSPLASTIDNLTGLLPGYLSGLVLAGANRPDRERRDDGMLTADETTSLDLSAVALVVLSACDTALGTLAAGEGLLGLQRAFHLAGAEQVVSSLWRVGDAASANLMQHFYRSMWVAGKSPAEALHDAKLAMLRDNRAAFDGDGRPATWGAWVLSQRLP